MTVQELIEQLDKIENKSLPVVDTTYEEITTVDNREVEDEDENLFDAVVLE